MLLGEICGSNEFEQHKDDCHSYLHEFRDGRIYACCYQEYACCANTSGGGVSDYIEIASSSKMEILEYRQGYTKKGYVDMCRKCRGIGKNAKKIPAAIQMPRKRKYAKAEINNLVRNKELIMTKTVSICVPIYNTSKYLTRCIDSLLGQTYHNLEIILIDDGSKDGCDVICDEYARIDSRVVVIHKENGGEASGRNEGLLAATGEYVMFIDSDDEYLPNAVELLIHGVSRKNIDLAIGGYLEESGEMVHFATGHLRQFSPMEAARMQISTDCPYGVGYILSTVNAKMFRRDILKEHEILFDESFVVGNDSLFMCEYLKRIDGIYDVFAPIYRYYKFHASERVQGMAWFYPDAFFLFAKVKDGLLKITKFDEEENNRQILKCYMDLIQGLLVGATNENSLKDGIEPYLVSLRDEVSFLRVGAELDLADTLGTNELCGVPTKIISYLVVQDALGDLTKLLLGVAKLRGMMPTTSEHVRLMNKNMQSIDLTSNPQLMAQLSGLIASLANLQKRNNDSQAINQTLQQQLEDSQATNQALQQQLEDSQATVEAYVSSTSWRVTKPMRIIRGLFAGK